MAAFTPADAGIPLAIPASGVEAAVPLDGEVLPVGVELGVTDGVGVVVGVVLGLEVGVGVVDSIGGAVDACPELYGVGLGLHVREVPGEIGAEE